TAPRLSTGSAPGRAMSTGATCAFGAAPKAVLAAEKILLLVFSWACTSSPMTTSQSVLLMLVSVIVRARGCGSVTLAAPPVDDDRVHVIVGPARAARSAAGETDRDLMGLFPDVDLAAVGRPQLHARAASRLDEGTVEAAAAAARHAH